MKAAKYALLCFFVDCVRIKGWTVFKEVRIAEPQVLPKLCRVSDKAMVAVWLQPTEGPR